MPKKNFPFLPVIFVLYCIIEIIGSYFHVLWADEMHSWCIAVNSSSISELLKNKAYQGHPDMWYFILYFLKQFTTDPVIMKLFHSFTAILSVFLFLRYSPFTTSQKALFVFGYFPLFEYAILNRNYGIEVLLLFVFLILYRNRGINLVWISVILFLMIQTNVFGMIMAISLAMSLAFEFLYFQSFRSQVMSEKVRLVISIVLFAAGLIYGVKSIMPMKDSFVTVPLPFGAITLQNFLNSVASFWRAMIPVPAPGIHFWDTNIVGSIIVQFILSVIMLFSFIVMFCKRPVILFLYVTGVTGILFFVFDFYTGSLRHHGHYYLLFIACLWIFREFPDRVKPLRYAILEKYNCFLTKNNNMLLTMILTIHMVVGVYCIAVQVFIPFSEAKRTAEFIREQKLERFTIAGDWDWYAASVAAYLNSEFYYYSRNAYSKYVILDNKRTWPPQSEIIKRTDSLSRVKNDTVLVLLNYPLKDPPSGLFRPVASFTNSVHPLEQYYLYLYKFRNVDPEK